MSGRTGAWGIFVLAVAVGTAEDRPPLARTLVRDGYDVLAADLHVHTFLGDGVSWPWEVAGEARRRGIDVIAITNHNQVFAARLGRWMAERLGGPMVLVGEEITARSYHLVAIGIEETVSWRQPADEAIADVHRQGGAAVAAHPVARFWDGYGAAARLGLDGSEMAHPSAQVEDKLGEMRSFHEQVSGGRTRPLARIGSSDHHVLSNLGRWRTFLFVRERTRDGVVDAIRHARTVAQDARGTLYGEPEWVSRLGPAPAPEPAAADRATGLVQRGARFAGWLALVLLVFLPRRRGDGS